jgi:hypothetical protein
MPGEARERPVQADYGRWLRPGSAEAAPTLFSIDPEASVLVLPFVFIPWRDGTGVFPTQDNLSQAMAAQSVESPVPFTGPPWRGLVAAR